MTNLTPITDPFATYVRATAPGDDALELDLILPPGVLAGIRELVANPRFPEYQTPWDVIRDAAVHRLEALRESTTDPRIRAGIEDYLRRVEAMESAYKGS
jgi:hypothetical protein